MGSFVFEMIPPVGDRGRCDPARDGAHSWVERGPCRARIANDGYGVCATLVNSPAGLAAGLVRLDNRREIRALAGCASGESDLAIIVAALARLGPSCIRQFEGDFAFVCWEPNRRALIAARDALGIRALYRTADPQCRAFASQAQLLGTGRPWSLEYIADHLVHAASRTYSPYDGVMRVPPGTYQIMQDGQYSESCYWSPYQFETNWVTDRRSAVDQFGTLFKDALRLHLTDEAGCWSQLSGGLDSSSIVSMAGWLAQVEGTVPPLRGTLTFVETVGIGDERRYSDTVIRDWPVRNEQLIDRGAWHDLALEPPQSDEPDGGYSVYARNQLVIDMLRSTGSRILLTGIGPDHYLHGNYSYFVDWIAKGRIRDATREMYREAVRNKVSFWKLAYQNGVRPFLKREPSKSTAWADWVHPSFARRFPVEERLGYVREQPKTIGRYFVTEAATVVDHAELAVTRGLLGDTVDVRYPFLHRPLVEFCLQLSPEMKVTDGLHKWILREAMRGILPEEVRRRTSKGFVNVGADRTLTAQQSHFDSLLEHSVLGEMECIDVPLARQALTQRMQRTFTTSGRLENLITLETWLTVKSGRWTTSDDLQSAT